jgi:hypothetical protein
MVYPIINVAIVKPYFGMVRELEIYMAGAPLHTITVVRLERSTSLHTNLDHNRFQP